MRRPWAGARAVLPRLLLGADAAAVRGWGDGLGLGGADRRLRAGREAGPVRPGDGPRRRRATGRARRLDAPGASAPLTQESSCQLGRFLITAGYRWRSRLK